MAKTKERKPTIVEQKINLAVTWLGELYVPTFDNPAQAEFCHALQSKFKLTRAQIANVTDLTERQVKTRLKQYRKFVATGEIPSVEYAEVKPSDSTAALDDLIDEELSKEEQSVANSEGTFLVRKRMIEDAIAEAAARCMPSSHDLKAVEKLWRSARTRPSKRRVETAVALKSDWHVGLENNHYNDKVAIEVNDRFIRKTLRLTELHRTQCEVRKIVYILAGDNIQGSSANFPAQRWTVRLTAADQTEIYIGTEVKNIETLLVDYDEVEVVAMPGNHGNIYPKKTSVEPAHANFETMAHRALRWAFRNEPRVKFILTDEWYNVIDIDSYKLLVTHGHHISGGGSLDGIRASFRKLQDILPYFDAFAVGHFHQFARLTMPQSFNSHRPRAGFMNGTAILGDTHSDQFGSAHSNQWWNFFVHDGSLTAEYPVNLYVD